MRLCTATCVYAVMFGALTVEVHSILMSRVTSPKIYEKFRACHGSPRGFTNISEKSQNLRKMGQKSLKNPNFALGAFSFGTPRRSHKVLSLGLICFRLPRIPTLVQSFSWSMARLVIQQQ